jgi:hypothetical protein
MANHESRSEEPNKRTPVIARFGVPFKAPLLIPSDIFKDGAANKAYLTVDISPFVIEGFRGAVEFQMDQPMRDNQPSMFPSPYFNQPINPMVTLYDIPPAIVDTFDCELTFLGKRYYSSGHWDPVDTERENNQLLGFHNWVDPKTKERLVSDFLPFNPGFVDNHLRILITRINT